MRRWQAAITVVGLAWAVAASGAWAAGLSWAALTASGSTPPSTVAEAMAALQKSADVVEVAQLSSRVEPLLLVPADARGAWALVLNDGQVWTGNVAGLSETGEEVVWSNRWVGRQKVPLAAVCAIIRLADVAPVAEGAAAGGVGGGGDAASAVPDLAVSQDQVRSRVLTARLRVGRLPGEAGDVVMGSEVRAGGAVTGLSAAGVVVEAGGQKQVIEWAKIDRVDFAPPQTAAPPPAAPTAERWLAELEDGSVLLATGRPALKSAEAFSMTVSSGPLEIPAVDCLRLQRVPGGGSSVMVGWLTALPLAGAVAAEPPGVAATEHLSLGGVALFPGGARPRPAVVRSVRDAGRPGLILPVGSAADVSLVSARRLTVVCRLSGRVGRGEEVGLFVSGREGPVAVMGFAGGEAKVELPLAPGRTTVYVAPVRGLCLGAGVELVGPVLAAP